MRCNSRLLKKRAARSIERARRWRKLHLSTGGSRDPADFYKAFPVALPGF